MNIDPKQYLDSRKEAALRKKNSRHRDTDWYVLIASCYFKKPIERVTPAERAIIKTQEFTFAYSSGPEVWTAAPNHPPMMTAEEASKLVEDFKRMYPGAYIDEVKEVDFADLYRVHSTRTGRFKS